MKFTVDPPRNNAVQPSPSLHLAEQRRAKNIALEEIAAATRISPLYLRAIEAEDFAQLPGGIYAVSYIRQYAAAARCDEATLLTAYRRAAAPHIQDDATEETPSNALSAFLEQLDISGRPPVVAADRGWFRRFSFSRAGRLPAS
jgi:transcriptional regulator with XRE-family HTH domain